jgi:hypothetical protein
MLHELAHNLRGPHDEAFFQHLDTLTREWYELQTSSSHLLPGQGFLTEGARLGGAAVSLDPRTARLRAAEMAERRKQMAEIMGNGAGQRLGGGPLPSSLVAARAEVSVNDYRCFQYLLINIITANRQRREDETSPIAVQVAVYRTQQQQPKSRPSKNFYTEYKSLLLTMKKVMTMAALEISTDSLRLLRESMNRATKMTWS